MAESDWLAIEQDIVYTRGTVMVAIAGFTILVWDHIITFDDEVELIWKRNKGLVVYLFLVNRYLTPLGFIVNLVAFTLPEWGTEHFVRYEGAMTVIGTQIAGLIMFLRVRALYNRQRTIVWGIILLFIIWLGVNTWLLTNGQAVKHAQAVHSCTMIFNPSISNIASSSAWLPLLYDTCIFALTLYKTTCRRGHLVRTLLSDGILYYSVICMVNVVLTIMIVRASQGVKNIAAQLELLLTVAMVSRITLNLKKHALEDTIHVISSNWIPPTLPRSVRARYGPARKVRSRSRATTAASLTSTPQRDSSTTFRDDHISYPEHVRLGTIYSISLTPDATPVTPQAVGFPASETPRSKRPGIEEGVEAM